MRFSDGSLSFIRIKYIYTTCSIIYVHEHGGIWGHSAQIEGDGMFFNVSQYSTILFLVFFRGHGPKFVWMERGKSNRFIFFRRRESIQNARVNSGERKKERKRERDSSSRNSRVG